MYYHKVGVDLRPPSQHKSDKLRLDNIAGLPRWPIRYALGVEPEENDLTIALRLMANAKVVG